MDSYQNYIVIYCQLDKKQEPVENEGELNLDPHGRPRTSCTIFLGFTSNIVSSGMRDIVRFLAEHNMVCLFLLCFV